MGERPLVWVQVMWLVEDGIGSKAETGSRAKECGNRLLAPAQPGRALLDGTGESGRPPMDMADMPGRSEAQVCKKQRRETESGRRLGFPGFGKADPLLFSRSRSFGSGLFL